jgi:hypothetical protein
MMGWSWDDETYEEDVYDTWNPPRKKWFDEPHIPGAKKKTYRHKRVRKLRDSDKYHIILQKFVDKKLEEGETFEVSVKELFRAWREWKETLSADDKASAWMDNPAPLCRSLHRFYGVSTVQRGPRGQQARFLRGIRVRGEKI